VRLFGAVAAKRLKTRRRRSRGRRRRDTLGTVEAIDEAVDLNGLRYLLFQAGQQEQTEVTEGRLSGLSTRPE
jgi:hypothetical protein